jgi:hypothetical protein
MHLISSIKETSDSVELIIRIYRYPTGDFLNSMAESELQFRLSDLFKEIELVLIACVNADEPSNDSRHLAASVTSGAIRSIVSVDRSYLPLLPFIY